MPFAWCQSAGHEPSPRVVWTFVRLVDRSARPLVFPCIPLVRCANPFHRVRWWARRDAIEQPCTQRPHVVRQAGRHCWRPRAATPWLSPCPWWGRASGGAGAGAPGAARHGERRGPISAYLTLCPRSRTFLSCHLGLPVRAGAGSLLQPGSYGGFLMPPPPWPATQKTAQTEYTGLEASLRPTALDLLPQRIEPQPAHQPTAHDHQLRGCSGAQQRA